MNDERDEDSGQFTAKYPAEDFLEALRELGGAGSTADVADVVGGPTRTAHYNLSKLEDSGEIDSRKVGNARLWTLADGE
jgi:predicted transcriptional regulator